MAPITDIRLECLRMAFAVVASLRDEAAQSNVSTETIIAIAKAFENYVNHTGEYHPYAGYEEMKLDGA